MANPNVVEELISQNPETEQQTSQAGSESEQINKAPTDFSTQLDSVKHEIQSAFGAVLQEKERRIRELESQVTRVEELNNKPPAITLEPGDLVQNPNRFLEAVSQIVQNELVKQVKPIQDFKNELEGERRFDSALASLRADPNLSGIAEHYRDEIKQILSGNGQEINAQTVRTAALLIPGLIVTRQVANRLGGQTTTSTPGNTGNTKPMPANLPPSPPAAPRKETQKSTITLSENEAKLARIYSMTPEQFVQFRDSGTDPRTWAVEEKK